MNQVMKRARRRQHRVPTASRCCATPTATALPRPAPYFLKGLNSPFGMALIGDNLYVANTDAVVRFPYKEGATQITEPGTKLADLPGGPLNHHWTKGLVGKHGRLEALRLRRLQQQRRRERYREGRAARRDPRDRRAERTVARVRVRSAQSGRHERGTRRPTSFGRWSTSATSWAAIWCRTT